MDQLLRSGVIQDDLAKQLGDTRVPDAQLCQQLLHGLLNSSVVTPERAHDIFCKSLRENYPNMSARIGCLKLQDYAECICSAHGLRSCSFCEQNIDGINHKADVPIKRDVDTSEVTGSSQVVHSESEKQPHNQLGLAVVRTSQQKSEDVSALIHNLHMVKYPRALSSADIRMASRLKPLWKSLFLMRVDGQGWKKHKLLCRGSYNSYDQRALINRELLIMTAFHNLQSSWHLSDPKWGELMAVIPKTSLPLWHLARACAMAGLQAVQENNFQIAKDQLDLAQQQAVGLAPSMATAAVHVCIAMYLSRKEHAENSMAFREHALDHLSRASEHLLEEDIFVEQAIVKANEMMLYSALLNLGVDISSLVFSPESPRFATGNTLRRAHEKLDIFEADKWNTSTPWSRTLFFIARAEEMRSKGSHIRALDYIKCANREARGRQFEKAQRYIKDFENWSKRQLEC